MTILSLRASLVLIALLMKPLQSLAYSYSCEQLKSTAEQSECANREWQLAEHELRLTFDAVLHNYTETKKEMQPLPKSEQDEQIRWEQAMVRRLKASQRTWLKYRESVCGDVEAMYQGGTITSVAVPLCKAELTRERTKFLQGGIRHVATVSLCFQPLQYKCVYGSP